MEETSELLVRDALAEECVIGLECVMRVIESEYSQRIDSDRIRNPHGEHAEEIWKVINPRNRRK